MSVLYLRSDLSDISLGTNNTNKLGTAVAWRAREATPAVSTGANVTATVASVNGPTAGLETGSPTNEWISPPLAAAATISGTITFNICAQESNAMANATVAVIVQRLSNTGSIVSTVVDSSRVTELGTANARVTWTATPTSTSFAKGDRIRIRVYFDDNATTTNMVTGYTLTLTYDGTNAATGDSNVDFAETLSFMSADPGPVTAVTSNTTLGSTNLIAVEHGAGTWVLTTLTGTPYTATDPTGTWTLRSNFGAVKRVVYQDGLWVAAASGATNAGKIFTSTAPQLDSWTNRFTTTAGFHGLAYANGIWVAVGESGRTATATSATGPWTLGASLGSFIFRDVAYGNGVWVAVGDTGNLWWSTNPAGTWTQVTSTPAGTSNILGVSYGQGKWIAAVSATNTTITATDPTGTWSSMTVPSGANGVSNTVRYLPNFTGGTWFLNYSNVVYTSTDGVNWTPQATVTDFPSVASNGTIAVAVGSVGTVRILTGSTPVYLTATASNITDQGASITELTAWTSRGNG